MCLYFLGKEGKSCSLEHVLSLVWRKKKSCHLWSLGLQEGITQLTRNLQTQWLFNQRSILISQRKRVRQAFSFLHGTKACLLHSSPLPYSGSWRGPNLPDKPRPGLPPFLPVLLPWALSTRIIFLQHLKCCYFIRSDLAWIHLLSRSVSPADPSPKARFAHANSHRQDCPFRPVYQPHDACHSLISLLYTTSISFYMTFQTK